MWLDIEDTEPKQEVTKSSERMQWAKTLPIGRIGRIGLPFHQVPLCALLPSLLFLCDLSELLFLG